MSFVEKALKRLKQQEKPMVPLGQLDIRERQAALDAEASAETIPAAHPAATVPPVAQGDPGVAQQDGPPTPTATAAPAASAPPSATAPATPAEVQDHATQHAGEEPGPPRPGTKIVAVDRLRLREEGFLAPDEYERRMADEYRRIKRPLIAHAFGLGATQVEKGNLILVTSAVSGEGKTHTCINLALSLATERDRTVLLIDGDVPKPHISRLFGIDKEPGLLDVLGDKPPQVEDVLVRTDIPRLSILPAGRWHAQATELLSSDRMRALCNELASRYPDRIILFDSPPMLAATEAQAIAANVGQVVLVVAENLTARDDVRSALSLIDENRAVNAILNKSRVAARSAYYGGYGYGYGANAAPPPG
ncbi:XrtA-associated tyrosine autokinase [Thioalkalivibrio sp. XN279]|uniref:XrtA-associated tyrosine autokinase n=1 Tax=Thioalkalivibrio sp. XN279 TaxID=2714953 RepID=UPI001407C061|nr:XrtA-associated tyrosine autokinase [Thioalkalivibrio sp. XN279]NHA15387.1 AAA family ATPase [Thioalkalivibrio sp. XN279]